MPMIRTHLLLIGLATASAYAFVPLRAPRCRHILLLEPSAAEERQNEINALREKKVDISRQAQEANVRAYRERAAFEEKRKRSAPPVDKNENDWRTSAAALDRLFSLDAEETLVTQDVEASEDEALALAAEAEAARYKEELANIDERIATLSGDTAAAEAARAIAEGAAAARAAADAAGPQAKRARATALEKAADAAAEKAARERQKAADARAQAEAAAEAARAIVERAASIEAPPTLSSSASTSSPSGRSAAELEGELSKLRVTLADLEADGLPPESLAPLRSQIEALEAEARKEQQKKNEEAGDKSYVRDFYAAADGWAATVADCRAERDAADAAAASAANALKEAMAAVALEGARSAGDELLSLELRARGLREASTAADLAAAQAADRYRQAVGEAQAGCEQAATMARTRAEALNAVADEAEACADRAVDALGEAMRVAEEARGG